MSILNDLVDQIDDKTLRDRIAAEVDRLSKQKKFGLVFEEHLPERTPLYEVPVKRGSNVARKSGKMSEVLRVIKIVNGIATCIPQNGGEPMEISARELVSVAEFGEPIYPQLIPMDTVENAPESDLWHTLIQADNYHALQLLEYLYAISIRPITPVQGTGSTITTMWIIQTPTVTVNGCQ